MGVSAAVMAAATVVSAGVSYYNGEQSRKQQGEAMNQAKQQAEKQATMQEQQINKANAKAPDVGAMLAGNTAASKGGQSGTMLTGPAGIDPSSLALSKNTLLGA